MSLITNIEQIRAASSINVSNTINNWRPYITEAEEVFIRPVIGSEFYDVLDGVVNGSGSGDSGYDELLVKVRTALSLYSIHLGIDEMSVSVGPQGIQVVATDSHKPAPEYQVLNLKESLLMRAHRNIDMVLIYLSQHREQFSDYTPVSHGCLIADAAAFGRYVDINGSRRVFLQLIPVMRNIEQRYIRPTISEDLYDELQEAVNGSGSSAISDDLQALLSRIQPALAYLTMARALQDITLDLLNWGAFQFAWSTFKSMRRMDEVNQDKAGQMMQAHQRDGEAALKAVQEWLDSNATADKYAAYFNSQRYVGAESAVTRLDFENSSDKSFFCP